jgi:hypothetical protein
VRRALACLALLAAAVSPVLAQAVDPIAVRAFEVRHRALHDARTLIIPALSAEGTVTLRPQISRLVVRDHASVLDEVAALLRSFDLPPRNVEVTLSLFLGSERREAGRQLRPESFARDVRGVTQTLGDFTKWTSYEALGSQAVTGSEGSRVSVDLSENYRVVFQVENVQEGAGGTIRLKDVSLQKLVRTADGTVRAQDLHTSTIDLAVGRLLVVGAAQKPDSPQALFLTLQARPR